MTINPTVVYALKKIHIARTTVVYSIKENFLGADCRVLNEGKLLGCPTVVPGLMKYRLVGTTYVHDIPISSFSTRCVRVRTEETGPYVHCVNGLDQNADWYVNRHGVDCLSGAIVIYTGCHARRVVLCYTPGRTSVRLQFLVCATPTVSIGIRFI